MQSTIPFSCEVVLPLKRGDIGPLSKTLFVAIETV